MKKGRIIFFLAFETPSLQNQEENDHEPRRCPYPRARRCLAHRRRRCSRTPQRYAVDEVAEETRKPSAWGLEEQTKDCLNSPLASLLEQFFFAWLREIGRGFERAVLGIRLAFLLYFLPAADRARSKEGSCSSIGIDARAEREETSRRESGVSSEPARRSESPATTLRSWWLVAVEKRTKRCWRLFLSMLLLFSPELARGRAIVRVLDVDAGRGWHLSVEKAAARMKF